MKHTISPFTCDRAQLNVIDMLKLLIGKELKGSGLTISLYPDKRPDQIGMPLPDHCKDGAQSQSRANIETLTKVLSEKGIL